MGNGCDETCRTDEWVVDSNETPPKIVRDKPRRTDAI